MKPIFLLVTPFFPTLQNWRGAYCYDFARALERAGKYRVVVLKEGDGGVYEIGGVKVYTFKARRLPSNIFPFFFKKFNQRSFMRKLKEALPCRGVERVEVCHCHTANYGVYAEVMKKVTPKCKTLLHHHDLQSFGLNNGMLRHCWFYNMIQFLILRRMHEKIDCHVFISEAVRRSFLAAPDTRWTQYEDYKKQMRWLPYRSVRIKDSIILHNGVDKSVFKVGDMSGSGTKDRLSFVIGCVGNFQPLKGQLTLLKAVQILSTHSTSLHGKKIKVVFVGSGETLEACKRFAAENGLDVEFKSEVKHEQLAEFYRGLDLFVLPSTFEGFGCVYTEAHSCGVPFVACEWQGMDDLIPAEDRDRWLCKQRDPEDLARRIDMYFENRYEQHLTEDQNIDSLMKSFIKRL